MEKEIRTRARKKNKIKYYYNNVKLPSSVWLLEFRRHCARARTHTQGGGKKKRKKEKVILLKKYQHVLSRFFAPYRRRIRTFIYEYLAQYIRINKNNFFFFTQYVTARDKMCRLLFSAVYLFNVCAVLAVLYTHVRIVEVNFSHNIRVFFFFLFIIRLVISFTYLFLFFLSSQTGDCPSGRIWFLPVSILPTFYHGRSLNPDIFPVDDNNSP